MTRGTQFDRRKFVKRRTAALCEARRECRQRPLPGGRSPDDRFGRCIPRQPIIPSATGGAARPLGSGRDPPVIG
jgi:hypothetical protein